MHWVPLVLLLQNLSNSLYIHSRNIHEPWRIPVGFGEQDLRPVFLEIYEGEHILVAGSTRSGKSTMLLAFKEILEQAHAADGQEKPA